MKNLKRFIILLFFIIFTILLIQVAPAPSQQEIIISRTTASDTYLEPNGKLKLVVGSQNFLNRTSGEYESWNWEKETKFYTDNNSLYIEWLNKKVQLEIYTKDNKSIKEKFKDSKNKQDLDLVTNIKKEDNKFIWEHNLTKDEKKQPSAFGYDIYTINTKCNPEGNSLICDEQTISFESTIEQNLNVKLNKDFIEISPKNYSVFDSKTNTTKELISNLSYIDPILSLVTSITMCGLNDTYDLIEVNVTGIINICEYDGTNGYGTLRLIVTNLSVYDGGLINGVGKGFRGSQTQNVASEGCGGGDAGAGGGAGGGGGYGGHGGAGASGYSIGGVACGSATNVTNMGYGGGPANNGGTASDGGGYLSVNASDSINIRGNISMMGLNGIGGASWGYGAGSGGGISLIANKIYGNGTVNASGGVGVTGGTGSGGGGAGGRIYIRYCDNSTVSTIYDVLGGSSLNGGTAGETGSISQALKSSGCITSCSIPSNNTNWNLNESCAFSNQEIEIGHGNLTIQNKGELNLTNINLTIYNFIFTPDATPGTIDNYFFKINISNVRLNLIK